MRQTQNTNGYTIVEVLIFLAVSGMMFLMAVIAVSGKQETSQFRQGVNSVKSTTQQAVNDVSNGFYPSTSFPCTAGATGAPNPTTGSNTTQGTRAGCVFLGKALQFNGDKVAVYSVIGRQTAPTGSAHAGFPPTMFSEAIPVVADQLTSRNTLEWGLQATKMFRMTGASSGVQLRAIGLYSSFSSVASASAGTLNTGSQSVTLVAYPGLAGGDVASAVATSTTDSAVLTNGTILVCLDNGGSKYGTMSIGGGNGQRLTVSTQILSAKAAVCS